MTNLDSILKSRGITLLTKQSVHLVKVVMLVIKNLPANAGDIRDVG